MGAICNGMKEKATDRKVTYTITQLITYLLNWCITIHLKPQKCNKRECLCNSKYD